MDIYQQNLKGKNYKDSFRKGKGAVVHMVQKKTTREIQSIGGKDMNKEATVQPNYEALYYEEVGKRFQAEEENEKLKKALINVCLKLNTN